MAKTTNSLWARPAVARRRDEALPFRHAPVGVLLLLVALLLVFLATNGFRSPQVLSAVLAATPQKTDGVEAVASAQLCDLLQRGARDTHPVVFVGDSSSFRSFRRSALQLVRCAIGAGGNAGAVRGGGRRRAVGGQPECKIAMGSSVLDAVNVSQHTLLTAPEAVAAAIEALPMRTREAPGCIRVVCGVDFSDGGLVVSDAEGEGRVLAPLSPKGWRERRAQRRSRRDRNGAPPEITSRAVLWFVRALYAQDVSPALGPMFALPGRWSFVLGFGAWDALRPTAATHGFEWRSFDTNDNGSDSNSADEDDERAVAVFADQFNDHVHRLSGALRAAADRSIARLVVRAIVTPNCTAPRFPPTRAAAAVAGSAHVTALFCRRVIAPRVVVEANNQLRLLGRDVAVVSVKPSSVHESGDGGDDAGVVRSSSFVNGSALVASGRCGVGDGVHIDDDVPACAEAEMRLLWVALAQ